MIASVEGLVGAIAADSLVVEVGGIGYRVFVSPTVIVGGSSGLEDQAAHVPPGARRSPGAVRVPLAGGAGLLQSPPVGDRGRSQGGPGDHRQPAGRRPPAGDHRGRPGDAHGDPGHRQAPRRAGDLRAQGEGRGRRDQRIGRSARELAATTRSSAPSRRSATRSARRAMRRGQRSGRVARRGPRRSRTGSRRPFGRSCATERGAGQPPRIASGWRWCGSRSGSALAGSRLGEGLAVEQRQHPVADVDHRVAQ